MPSVMPVFRVQEVTFLHISSTSVTGQAKKGILSPLADPPFLEDNVQSLLVKIN